MRRHSSNCFAVMEADNGIQGRRVFFNMLKTTGSRSAAVDDEPACKSALLQTFSVGGIHQQNIEVRHSSEMFENVCRVVLVSD